MTVTVLPYLFLFLFVPTVLIDPVVYFPCNIFFYVLYFVLNVPVFLEICFGGLDFALQFQLLVTGDFSGCFLDFAFKLVFGIFESFFLQLTYNNLVDLWIIC